MIEKGLVKIYYEEVNPDAEKPIHLSIRGETKDLIFGLIRIAVTISNEGGYTIESVFDSIIKTHTEYKKFFDDELK